MNTKKVKHIGLRSVLVIVIISVMAVAAYATTKLVSPSTDKVELVDKSTVASFDVVVNSQEQFAGVEFGLEPSSEEVEFKNVSYSGDFAEKQNVKAEKDGVVYFGVFDGTNAFKSGEQTVATASFEYAGKEEVSVKLKSAQVVKLDENGNTVSESVSEAEGFRISIVRKESDKVAAVRTGIEGLANNVSLKDKAKVNRIKAQYDALTDEQKSMIDGALVTKLNKAVSSIKTLQNKAIARVKTVTVNVKTVNAKAVDSAVKKAGGSNKYVTKIVLGKKVKSIKKNTFKKYRKVKVLEVRTKKLTKRSVKGSLKGSAVKMIKVKVGKTKTNKKMVKKYKKIFTKKNAGKKVKVKR